MVEIVQFKPAAPAGQESIVKMLEDAVKLAKQGRIKAAGLALVMVDDFAQTMFRNTGSVAPLVGAAFMLARYVEDSADIAPAETPEPTP